MTELDDVLNHLSGGEENRARRLFAEAYVQSAGADEIASLSETTVAAWAEAAFDTFENPRPGTTYVSIAPTTARLSADAAETTLSCLTVITPDKPFLVDSIVGELQARGIQSHFVAHPIVRSRRDAAGKLAAIGRADDGHEEGDRESFIQIMLAPVDADAAADLKQSLEAILESISQIVDDWEAMRYRVVEVTTSYQNPALTRLLSAESLNEARDFLQWLEDGNFTFLGMREYRLVGGDLESGGELEPQVTEGLGILRDPNVRVLRRGREMVDLTPEVRRFYAQPQPLIITKANVVSTVHRRVHMDYIGVKRYSADGSLIGELRIAGLFTSTAYNRSVMRIPVLRQLAERLQTKMKFTAGSHSAKALENVLETFPRDELFQISEDDLQRFVAGILDLAVRPRTRVFARADEFDRFVSILVFLPRDRYSTQSRVTVGDYFADVFHGRVSAFKPTFMGELVRVQFIIGRYEGTTPVVSEQTLEREVVARTRNWDDDLQERLALWGSQTTSADAQASAASPGGGAQASAADVRQRFSEAFSVGYRADHSADRAIADIQVMQTLGDDNPLAMDMYRRDGDDESMARVAIYRLDRAIPLSRRVPFFENLGFDVIEERTYHLRPLIDGAPRTVRMHDMALRNRSGGAFEIADEKDRLVQTFFAVWSGRAHDDTFNKLVRSANATWRDAAVLRAYAAYMRQIRIPFGDSYVAETLHRQASITANLIALFHARFDPEFAGDEAGRTARQAELSSMILEQVAEVSSLDEDRTIRHVLNLISATLRTNVFCVASTHPESQPEAFTFKLESGAVESAPEPRPHREILVFSPRVEGIHLRGGAIARGGLRWSDRSQDFRTEVLGLAKAQQVKNAVIVPAGAKGGFVPKHLPVGGTREEFLAEGIAAYELFVGSLIDLTDNITTSGLDYPDRVVRHDGDDPYLVVAADKGTAALSDNANALSEARNFWLGDAFASGGSAGYDHKKMAITARGAWEAVKRHFREMDHDIQAEPFTVVGVGDMSGDVFGNGMLLSRKIRLLAAFDHRDIFIDPSPDPETTWIERKRIFDMGRSSWQDYDTSLLSPGGGIFSRSAKSIPLSPEIRQLLAIDAESVTPNELMRAILVAHADLLWFGGIGTYVKSVEEADADVGDRANDAIRVAAAELNVRVVGEGANLGLTQRGRIAFAARGGRTNTDAIDNSAGVNSSDQEVNIKIALGAAERDGKIDRAERNAILVEMTDDVANACLRNNYLQSLALSLGERRGAADGAFQERLMRDLESRKLLDRGVEDLPPTSDLTERLSSGRGLTRPELAVLLGYSKIALFADLVESAVPDDPMLQSVVHAYFPPLMRERFASEIEGHRLRREIIATELTNQVVNRGGSTMVVRLMEETGHSTRDVVYAFVAVREVFGLDTLWSAIDALDTRTSGAHQLDLYLDVQSLVREQTSWFLRHVDLSGGLSDVVSRYAAGAQAVISATPTVASAEANALTEAGMAPDIAQRLTQTEALRAASNITLAAEMSGVAVADAMAVHKTIDAHFRLGQLAAAGSELQVSDYYDRLAVNAMVASVSDAHRELTRAIVSTPGTTQEKFAVWLDTWSDTAGRLKAKLDDVLDGGDITLARLTVAAAHARDVVTTVEAASDGGSSSGHAA